MKALKIVIGLFLISVLVAVSANTQSSNTDCNSYSYTRGPILCLDGESFSVEGTFCETARERAVKNGWKEKYKFRQKDVITDLATGEVYYLSIVGNQTYNLHWWKPQTDAITVNWTWCLEDSNGNVIFNRHGTRHFTTDANGNPVVSHDLIWDIICGGR